MKKAFLPLLLLLASCQEAAVEGVTHRVDAAGTPPLETTLWAADADQIIDPVCGMVKTDSWTNYSLYKGDTVWFCAAVEKKAFDANPEKYAAKLESQP